MSSLNRFSSRPDARAATALAAAVVFAGSWAVVHASFYSAHQLVDTPIYEGYGEAVRSGQVPYRDFDVEYPPGALPVFVAPAFLHDYRAAFGTLMAVLGVLCVVLVVLARGPPWAVVLVAVSPLLIGSLVYSRFDFWPAALLAGSLAALLGDRHRLGWGLLGAAVAAKLYPAALVPLAVVWTLRRRGGRELAWAAGIGAAVVAVAFVPFLVLAPHGLWTSVSGQLTRPLQIESLAASVLTTFGHPEVVGSHGSQNVAGHGVLAALTSVCGAAALVALWVGFARGPAEPERLVRYAAGCVCAFVVFGKVLSPQYLIWLVPLVALVRGLRGVAAVALLAAALLTTQVWFPGGYWDYVRNFDHAGAVLARNLLLLALLVVLSLPARARARSS
jgi:uncharacterized membrane protein